MLIPRLASPRAGAGHYRVGFLGVTNREGTQGGLELLERAMRDLGYVEGKNLTWEMRFAEGKYERLPSLAADLVERRVDVIIASGSPSTHAAQKATSRIPIVSLGSVNPVAAGIVKNLARPEGNITGISGLGIYAVKRSEILKSVFPGLRRIGLFINSMNSAFSTYPAGTLESHEKIGLEAVELPVATAEDIERAFVIAKSKRLNAISVPVDGFLNQQRRQFADLALSNRLPSVGGNRRFVEAGGLVSYGQNTIDFYPPVAELVDRLLNGAKPGDLPFRQLDKIDLCLNRKTAAALGISIPQEMLLRADLVIE